MRALYVLTLMVHLVLLWWLPFLPTQDGPSHLYNALILRDLLEGGTLYGRFFDLRLSFVPNLGAIVPLYGLLAVLPPLQAEKVFVSVFCVLLAAAVPRLARTMGGTPYPASFLVFPLFVSELTLPGFYPWMMGVSLWVWALSATWWACGRSLRVQWLVCTSLSVLLFVCHFLVFACYVLALAAAVVVGPAPVRGGVHAKLIAAAAKLGTPAVLVTWFLVRLVLDIRPAPGAGQAGLLTVLASSFDPATTGWAIGNLLTFAQPAASAWLGWTTLVIVAWVFCRSSTRPALTATGMADQPTEAALGARRWLLLLAAALLLSMLLVPDELGELRVIKSRFPAMIVVLVPALVAAARPLVPQRRSLLAIALVGTLWNAVILTQAAGRVETFVTGAQVAHVQGQVVAGYRLSPEEQADTSLLHATSYYCLLRGCVDISNYQAHSHQFFVRFKESPALRSIDVLEHEPTTVDWGLHPSVAFVFGWQLDEPERQRIRQWFDLHHDTGDVSVWRRRASR